MKISEDAVFGISFLFVLLSYYAFQKDLGVGLALLVFGTYFFILRDKRQEIFIEKKPDKIKSIIIGISLWISSIFVTSITAPFIGKLFSIDFGNSSPLMVLQSIVGIQQSMSSLIFSEALPLAGNIILTLLAIGIFFPINETFFEGVLYEFFKEKIKTKFTKVTLASIGIIGLISLLMVFYHFGAKGIDDKLALWSVFVFFFLTIIFIIVEKQMLGAIFGHILNNSIALFIFYKLFSAENVSAIITFTGLIALIFFFSLETLQIRILGRKVGG